MLRSLYYQLSNPSQLEPLGLVEVLDWTAAALDRVDREEFFKRFDQGEAVQYFYEPFLEAFDPALRKQLGVWYTPSEVVKYMVARVDMALKDDLDIPEGLAAENVYVLDPCCGTGAYVSEVLKRIAHNLKGQWQGALLGSANQEGRHREGVRVRDHARAVRGGSPSGRADDAGPRRATVGQPAPDWIGGRDRARRDLPHQRAHRLGHSIRCKQLTFPELQEERDRAERMKQQTPVLVILGNPPYNGYAGMAVDEERELSTAYRTTRLVRKPEGQGLNDLYVRFFRMAERRITEKTGQGVVCFISNYSWLDGLSFTGMREKYLEEFDAIRIDNLHGDRIISEYAPDGRTSETVFAIQAVSRRISRSEQVS